jgi:hypothetical protein
VKEESLSAQATLRIEAPAARIFENLASPQRHQDFDGSDMLRGAGVEEPISGVGDVFTMKMHRLGRDYSMINYVVEYERDRRIFWEPAPGDLDTAGDDPAKIGVPAGYRWGFVLEPDGADATFVTEIFDCGSRESRWILQREEGRWINGSNTVLESMSATLNRLAVISTDGNSSLG